MKQLWEKVSEKIQSLDMYGQKPQLNIDKNESFKTPFGSLLTILSVITSILALSYFSTELFNVSNPKLVYSVKNIFRPPRINLNNTNYGFAFGLQNPFTYDQFVDESVYRAEAYHMTGKRSPSGFDWSVEKLELETCNINKFPEDYHKLYIDLPMANLYCLKNTSFSLFGTFLNDDYQYIILKLFECKNKTNNNNNNKNEIICQPKSYIDGVLAGTFFTLAHSDLTIDPTNYTNPNQKYSGDSYTTVSNKFFREMHHYLNVIDFQTDKGWLIEDTKKETFLKLDYIKEMTDFRKADNFLSYTIKLSTKIETYSRSFAKVQNVAADSGGFLKIISIICMVASHFYNKAKFYQLVGQAIMTEKIHETKEIDKSINMNFKNKDFLDLDSNCQIIKKEEQITPFSVLKEFRKINNAISLGNNHENNPNAEINNRNKSNRKNINNYFTKNEKTIQNLQYKGMNNLKVDSTSNCRPSEKSLSNNLGKTSSEKDGNMLPATNPKEIPLDNFKKMNNNNITENENIRIVEENPENHVKEMITPKWEKKRRLTMNVSFCESFWYFICLSCRKTNKNFKKLTVLCHKIDEQMDILNVIRTINDLKTIKTLILDDEQIKLFNFHDLQEVNLHDSSRDSHQNIKTISFYGDREEVNQKQKDFEFEKSLNLVAAKDDAISKKLVKIVNK